MAEETGVRVDPAAIRELRVRSGSDGTLLIFATAPAVSRDDLDAFRPSPEVSELVITHGPRDDIVFPLDAEVVAERFSPPRLRRRRAPAAGADPIGERRKTAADGFRRPKRRD